jgi:hypothetical protein
VVRATHVAARGGGFSLRNGHGRLSLADKEQTAPDSRAHRGARLCPNRRWVSSRRRLGPETRQHVSPPDGGLRAQTLQVVAQCATSEGDDPELEIT